MSKDTFLLMAKKLQEKFQIKGINDLEVEKALIFLPTFLEEIFIKKSMIDLIITEEDYKDDFTRKFKKLIFGAWSPNGWTMPEELVWKTITKNQIIVWVKINCLIGEKQLPVEMDDKIIDLVYVYITETYKTLSAIIKEEEEKESV